jgi:hypothetical protein
MITLSLVFLIAALVLFIVAAIGVPTPPRFNLVAAGLACFIAAQVSGVIR